MGNDLSNLYINTTAPSEILKRNLAKFMSKKEYDKRRPERSCQVQLPQMFSFKDKYM